ncbi:MAG: acetyl-CoA carboxylase carboxyltransferase subunit alpha [Pyrinomonadaceae bacterium]
MANKNTAFERVRTARHPERPYSIDVIENVFDDFIEIHGDRRYSDDPAIVCGFAKIEEFEVCVIGQQKGRDTNQRRYRNFAMSKPEGYRKALRAMKLAEKFARPILTIIDTPGAYPGIDAEERGQAEAIAYNLREMAGLRVPIICLVLGEGGSGGALAIAIGDQVLMMENAVYSVITPEGCAAILWKDAGEAERAAESLKLTAAELMQFKLIDEIVNEDGDWIVNLSDVESSAEPDETMKQIKKVLLNGLQELSKKDIKTLLDERYKKFRQMGAWAEV